MIRRLVIADAGVLLIAAAFELALALGASHVGPQPGDAAWGQDVVGPAAFVALFGGAFLGAFAGISRDRAVGLLAPSAGLFVLATSYTVDPYYAPSSRRFSESGTVSTWVLVAALATSVAVAVLGRFRPRIGATVATFAVLGWVVLLIAVGDGH